MNVMIQLKGETFASFEDFGKAIFRYPEESYQLINSAKFLKILRKESPSLYDKVEALRQKEHFKERFLFQAQYLFYPLCGLTYQGRQFKNYQDLGKQIISFGPQVDIYLKDFLKYGLLTWYMRSVGDDKKREALYRNLCDLERDCEQNENRCYFKMGFLLEESMKIVYRRRRYTTIESFFAEAIQPHSLREFAQDLERNQYIFAWLEMIGKTKELSQYESLVSTIEQWEEQI